VFNEVTFVQSEPEAGGYEPLLGYILLEQSRAAVDLDRYTARYENSVLVAAAPTSRIAVRARGARENNTVQPAEGALGYQGQRPWLVVHAELRSVTTH
jgi:hypothetical protein